MLLRAFVEKVEQTVSARVKKITLSSTQVVDDRVAVEEPLEIQLSFMSGGVRVVKPISVTMRTPGQDAELATGFLHTEGILQGTGDIEAVRDLGDNRICVVLRESVEADLARLERHFYTSSSCGVCGKASLEALKMEDAQPFGSSEPSIPQDVLLRLSEQLRSGQQAFTQTGGLHAAGLFTPEGALKVIREDVGRHNAVDKVVGSMLNTAEDQPTESMLMVSGRTSFEILQKAIRAGIQVVVAVGAPSSLAVELANVFNVTLIGFLTAQRFNIYSAPERVLTSDLKD